MRQNQGWTACLMCLAMAACGQSRPAADVPPYGFVRGQARVVAVDPVLGRAILDIGGRHIQAYWNTQRVLAGPGSFFTDGPLSAPTVNAHDPIVREQNFPAKPGELIAYIGMRTGEDDLFLRGVTVVGH
jgi:hypothetical protein